MLDLVMHIPAFIPMDIPDVRPVEPPGMGGLKTLLNWISWGVLVICVVGFLVGVAVLAFGEHNPETRGGKKIIMALIGAVLVGAISGIFAAFTGGTP
ncbi:hypothetical protein CGZ98_03735 [Enemella evansiae]|uniref:hypothetical protein n=1 Tax=Enemella evansiae TaxID=2016499 RepID=UPI000B961C4E|nr:hypothetical protein [Enemella evansiae]OYO15530.1 hypothetical protein CGZ98_03735 [Enemella evansiae]